LKQAEARKAVQGATAQAAARTATPVSVLAQYAALTGAAKSSFYKANSAALWAAKNSTK